MKYSSEILFCDNHLLIALKPCGMLTQPAPEGGDSLEEFAKEWVKRQYKKPGNVYLHAIHRLDRPVSGLVLFARTSKALSRLNEQQRDQEIQRVYVAEVEGIMPSKEGRLDHYLIHGDHRAIIAKEGDKEAKHARLTYQVIRFKDHTTFVAIELETGRYHQIRAQFSASGHPIVGDRRYGAKTGDENAIHLHCMKLAFEHPVTKELVQFETPAPFN
ncbi:MAG: RNA pseudouridine synthase [Parachlamydiales bacterium]|nr:RNA pseudouridine synthase [Parachlamydiales bacterium]